MSSDVSDSESDTEMLSLADYDKHFQRGFQDAAKDMGESSLGEPPARSKEDERVTTEKEAYRRGYNLAVMKVMIRTLGTEKNWAWAKFYMNRWFDEW